MPAWPIRQLATSWPPISIWPTRTSRPPSTLIARAAAAEDAALAVAGVTNSEGASAGWGRSRIAMAASNGFAGAMPRTRHCLSRLGARRRRHGDGARLRLSPARAPAPTWTTPAVIGRRAGEKAVARLNPRRSRPPACRWSSTRASPRGLLGHLAGRHQRRRDRPRHQLPQGQAGPAGLRAGRDDRRRPAAAARPALPAVRRRGHAGQPPRARRRRRADHLAARPAQRPASSASPTTGHAARGDRRRRPRPAPTNLYLEAGTLTPEALMADIRRASTSPS